MNIIRPSLFQILSLISVLGYFLGVLNIHFSDKNNYCVMTFMYEYPQFVRIKVPGSIQYPQYALYAYSEGRFTERARKMWFDGVPVLFLPGNSGSHMQARSLASVALRKALSRGSDFHFDFFTVSYNEDYSALYGGVLEAQTSFAAACVSRILGLYKNNNYTKSVPTSVILIGHSMGGLVAKRLLAHASTLNSTNIAITLSAPLQAPVINFDTYIDQYYRTMDMEWYENVNSVEEIKNRKLLLSFSSGPRDLLVPSSLTYSNNSLINALATAIPGVWVSPDHVSMVWCKQLVMAINKFLFDIVDTSMDQISEDHRLLRSKAKQYFQANRSMTLSPDIDRHDVTMMADGFWYEDNRRIYQISRPEIDKTTYLMIRLVNFPQNRFVAVETVNIADSDWLFGCNAKFTHHTHRYCKQGTSLTELSRWTGAAKDFGKRKLATVNLHKVKEAHPDWSHVVVKVSPTRKPIVLNVDINDYASRRISVDLPSDFSFAKKIIKQETEPNSLYYELVLPDFNAVNQAYLLYVEPTESCKAMQYHVSAEVHVPWMKNSEYYHYFTHTIRSPMKLRLYSTNTNLTLGYESTEHVTITLLLDPQCTYTISISSSLYHRLAQLVRNYSTAILPYMAAIILLAVRSNILQLRGHGPVLSMHSALASESVKPYYALFCGSIGTFVIMSIPLPLYNMLGIGNWKNIEMLYFMRSLLVLPTYMTALGLLNIAVAAVLAIMVFSSQLVHRLLFRILWRGGYSVAEKVASGLQKVPLVVSVGLLFAAQLSCGGAALVAGAAFYGFMLSKMCEEYLEDSIYKLMAKVASRMCRVFISKTNSDSQLNLVARDAIDINDTSKELIPSDSKDTDCKEDSKECVKMESKLNSDQADSKYIAIIEPIRNDQEIISNKTSLETKEEEDACNDSKKNGRRRESKDVDEELNNFNFHMMLFFMWMVVTLVNGPALITWAREFKYSTVLRTDTSYGLGLIMAACSTYIWQINGPRRNLRHYDFVAEALFAMAIYILILGPIYLIAVNHGVTLMFVLITLQQVWDKEEVVKANVTTTEDTQDQTENIRSEQENNENISSERNKSKDGSSECNSNDDELSEEPTSSETSTEDCVCDENRIYTVFKNLREKFSFSEN